MFIIKVTVMIVPIYAKVSKRMKTNIIYNDDCIKILNSKIDEKSIDLIFADPPYNLSGNGLKWKGNKTDIMITTSNIN
jgi:DNA modification methylase